MQQHNHVELHYFLYIDNGNCTCFISDWCIPMRAGQSINAFNIRTYNKCTHWNNCTKGKAVCDIGDWNYLCFNVSFAIAREKSGSKNNRREGRKR